MAEMTHEELVTAGGREARLKALFDEREAKAAKAKPAAKADTAVEGYDPADDSVADVLAYVADHPDEAAAVLAAEQAGKDRKGVVEGLQRVVAG